jgi:hypothetical protein
MQYVCKSVHRNFNCVLTHMMRSALFWDITQRRVGLVFIRVVVVKGGPGAMAGVGGGGVL